MEESAPVAQPIRPSALSRETVEAVASSGAESITASAPLTAQQDNHLSFEEDDTGHILKILKSLQPGEVADDEGAPAPPAEAPEQPAPLSVSSAPAITGQLATEPPAPSSDELVEPKVSPNPGASGAGACGTIPSQSTPEAPSSNVQQSVLSPGAEVPPIPADARQRVSSQSNEDEVDQDDIEAVAAAMAASGWNLEDLGDLEEDQDDLGAQQTHAPEQVSNKTVQVPSDASANEDVAPLAISPRAPTQEAPEQDSPSKEQREEEASHAALLALLSAATAAPSLDDTASTTDSAQGTPARDTGTKGLGGHVPIHATGTSAANATWTQAQGSSSQPMALPEGKKRRGRPPKQPPLESTQFITTPEGHLIGESTFTAAGLHFESQSPIPAGSMDDWSQAEPHRTAQGDVICPFPGCGKFFPKNRAYNLKAHLRSHGPFRPYKCLRCDMAFTRKHDLERHARKHVRRLPLLGVGKLTDLYAQTGDKPYLCEVCYASFQRSDALRHHWRSERACGLKIAEMAQEGTLGQHAHDLLNGGNGDDDSDAESVAHAAPPPPPAFPLSSPFPPVPPMPLMPPQPVKRKRGRPRKNPQPPAPAAPPPNPWSMMGSFPATGMPPMFPYNPYGFSPFMPFMSPYGYGMMGGQPLVPPPPLAASASKEAGSTSESESGSESESESDSGVTDATAARTEDVGLGDALRQLQRLQDQLDREEAGKKDKGKAVFPATATAPASHSSLPVSSVHGASPTPPPAATTSTSEAQPSQSAGQSTAAAPTHVLHPKSAVLPVTGTEDSQKQGAPGTEGEDTSVKAPQSGASSSNPVAASPPARVENSDAHVPEALSMPTEDEDEDDGELVAAAAMWTTALANVVPGGAGQHSSMDEKSAVSSHGEALAANETPVSNAPIASEPEPPTRAQTSTVPAAGVQSTEATARDDDGEDIDLAGLSEEDLALLYAAAQEAAVEEPDDAADTRTPAASSAKRFAELSSLPDEASAKRLRVG